MTSPTDDDELLRQRFATFSSEFTDASAPGPDAVRSTVRRRTARKRAAGALLAVACVVAGSVAVALPLIDGASMVDVVSGVRPDRPTDGEPPAGRSSPTSPSPTPSPTGQVSPSTEPGPPTGTGQADPSPDPGAGRSADATEPGIPEGTGNPTPADVDISAVQDSPQAADVQVTLGRYFGGIDSRQYRAAYATYSPARQNEVPYDVWLAGVNTSTHSNITVHGITVGAQGILVQATFSSSQAADKGPRPGETCTTWSMTYEMIDGSTATPWLIDGALDVVSRPC